MENINSEISECHAINIYDIPIHAINVKVVCKSESERERNIERNTIIHDNRRYLRGCCLITFGILFGIIMLIIYT